MKEDLKIFAYEHIISNADSEEQQAIKKTCCILYVNKFANGIKYIYFYSSDLLGFGEEDLNSEENVIKEIYEELSARATNIKYLGSVIADSGLMGNKVSVYECEIDCYVQKEANEGIVDIIEVSYDELTEMVKQEEIDDGFTLSAIAMVLCG